MKRIATVALMLLTMCGVNPASANSNIAQQQTKVNKVKQTQQGKEIFRLVEHYSKKYNVDPKLIHSIILVESGYNPKATSSHGAVGLMQLMPATAKARGCNNPYSPACNIEAGTKHMAGLIARHGGNEYIALASYNAGGGNVDRSLRKNGHIPPYTKGYVYKVQHYKNNIQFSL